MNIGINYIRAGLFCTTATLLITTFAQPVAAQTAPADVATAEAVDNGEILVTARKRNETALSVPVAIYAIDQKSLERYAVRDFSSLATQVPGLLISPVSIGSGGAVALRGISSTALNPSGDQAVSFNVDGIQISSANILRMGMIDIAQVEVLKGPQALFFGKNSPAGIISLRTADPGNSFEAKIVGDYEFNARQRTLEVAMGGPLTETLGVRLVGYGSKMSGYRKDLARAAFDPVTGQQIVFAPAQDRGPRREEHIYRGTLVYKPTADFSLRGKYTYGRFSDDNDPNIITDRIACPYGIQQTSIVGPAAAQDDCKADNVSYLGGLDPRQIARFPQYFSFLGFKSNQQLGSVEANYKVAPDIALTSVSGYYKLHDHFIGNPSHNTASFLLAGATTDRREYTQEVRIATSRADWPVNFTAGGYYQDAKFSTQTPLLINIPYGTANLSGPSSYNQFFFDTKAYSFFGQAIWKITDQLELAGGARWSHESKDAVFFSTQQVAGGTPTQLVKQNVALNPSHIKFTDTSPEVTLSWKPSTNLTVFGAFRNGFKSGGFQSGAGFTPVAGGLNLTYRPEDVRGGEFGIKARVDGLRINATAYRYDYKNLQVSTLDPVRVQQRVFNAASARIQGLELDGTYRPGIPGLELRGTLNYNHARYRNFLAGCYTGQTTAAGCNLNPAPPPPLPAPQVPGPNRQQDLSGRQMVLAPDWTGSAGVSYTTQVGGNLQLSLSGDARYSSSYWGQLEEAPLGRQRDYWMFDASVRVGPEDGAWQMALIGKNLTQVYRTSFVSQAPLTGIASRTGTALTGGLADLTGIQYRGRQISLQLSLQFR